MFSSSYGREALTSLPALAICLTNILAFSQQPTVTDHANVGRKGKRSALVDHQTKNKEHKQLSQEMEMGLKRVMLVAGVSQRLLGKVAIVTGLAFSSLRAVRDFAGMATVMRTARLDTAPAQA